jgi:hypothetical protein
MVSRAGLVFDLRDLEQEIVVPLPTIIAGLTYDSVQIVEDRVELAFLLGNVRLKGL